MKEEKIIENYWNETAVDFDKIYTGNKSFLGRRIDKVFRKDMYQRFDFTFENTRPYEGKTVLDVGCGTGHFAVEYAKMGAKKVVGIDLAQNMIKLSNDLATKNRVNKICEFIKKDVLEFNSTKKFDYTLAIGVYDYIKDPLPRLKKMHSLTKNRAVITFPRLWTWRAPIRKIRLTLEGCPVYFFSKRKVEKLMKEAGFKKVKIEKVGKIFCVVGYVE